MTWFNFLRKDTIIDFYTDRADVFNFSPIQRAGRFIPTWWKELPKTSQSLNNPLVSSSTMRQCVGFTDLFSQGFMLPLWSDVAITIGKQQEQSQHSYHYRFADSRSEIEHHGEFQWNRAYPLTHYQHLKLLSPWRGVCKEDIKFLAIQPTWNIENPEDIFIVPGAVSFKYQCGTNINLFYKRKLEDAQYILEHDQPLLHYIPLTEKRIKIQTHLVSPEELNRITNINMSIKFTNSYRAHKRILQQSGCPFNFKAEK